MKNVKKIKKEKRGERKLKKLFSFLLIALLSISFVACGGDPTSTEGSTTTEQQQTTDTQDTQVTTEEQTTTTEDLPNVAPELSGVADVYVVLNGEFDPYLGVTALDEEDGDLSASVAYTGTYDLAVAGDYDLVYTVTDSEGESATATRTVHVLNLTLSYPYNGFYNYKFATTDLRHTFMAAAEKYLMNNMAAGVPLFANGGFVLYSPRLALPVEEYVAVMGYGTSWGSFTADDSTVLMDDGELGEAGEYTYRTTISTNPGTFNQWLYDTSTDSDLMGAYMDSLYEYKFNADKTGYELAPSLAASNPVPTNSRVTDTGKEVAYTWSITLRDDLDWFFHPDTLTDTGIDPSAFDTTIDANDFVNTYKLALEQQWFRAVSGGGDFLNETTGIQGAQAFVDAETATPGSGDWDAVGIKVADGDDLTFTLTFVNEMSEWNVRYFMGSFVMNPINLELYVALEADGDATTEYGLDESSIAYCGPYYVDYYEEDKILRYEKNPSYYAPDKFFYTGYTFMVIEDSAVVFQEFIAGKLEGVTLPTEEFDNYKDNPGIKQIPGATTFRIMINGLETVTKQQEQFPGSTWVPEPILANVDFKMAMFFAVDRQKLAEEVLKTRTTNMYLFSDAYLVDAEMGVPYRATDQGLTVGVGLSPSTYGFNPDAATALYEKALNALVAAGTYTAGTAADPTIITIEFNYFSGSESQVTMFEYLETAFESAFQSTTHYINVDLVGFAKDFPDIYYDYMMIGEFDLSIGGISGSTLDAASFLDTYCSDNRGGFTLNWGIDTSVAEIPVLYQDAAGVWKYEEWSFDAITAALNGKVFIVDGEEAEVPSATITDITASTVTFDVEQWDSIQYDDIWYSVWIYDAVADEYVISEDAAFVDVDITGQQTVTITGLTPYYYWYNADGAVEYRSGDYKIEISYGVVVEATANGVDTTDPSVRASNLTAWFPMDEIIYGGATGTAYDSMSSYVANPTEATITLVLDESYDQADITGVVVVDLVDFSVVDAASYAVDYSVAGTVEFTGLQPGGNFLVEFTFTDGNWDCFRVKTPEILSADVAYGEGTVFAYNELNVEDAVRTISDAEVLVEANVLVGDDPATTEVVETDYVEVQYVEVVAGEYQNYVVDGDNPATTEVVEDDWSGYVTVECAEFMFSADFLFVYGSGLAEGEVYYINYVFSDAFEQMEMFTLPVEEAAE